MVKTNLECFIAFRGRSGRRHKAQILSFLSKYLGFAAGDLVQEYEKIFQHVVKHEGVLSATKKAKAWYDVSLRLASDLAITPLPFTKSGKNGYPKLLAKFETYLTQDRIDSKRAVLTVLQLYKLVESQGEPSFRGITAPYAGQIHPEWLGDYERTLEKMFPSDKKDFRIAQLKPGYHISGKNGPNGPSLSTAHVDRLAISGTIIEEACRALAYLTGFDSLTGLLNDAGAATEAIHKRGRTIEHSRIRIKYESGGKSRPFAIVDFFSQSALKSIHTWCMDWLKQQQNDGTRSHDEAAQAVKSWTVIPDIELFSFDLTEATNRWPLFLQYLVVKQLFGEEIAFCWKTIITDREFTLPNGDSVKFECGQPLGALSSWAVFAISHHAVTRCACYRAWKDRGPSRRSFIPSQEYDKYRIIGDDICIRSRPIANIYQRYLGDLAVDFSLAKSILPEDNLSGSPCGELAKRVFKGGQEITPIPPDAILVGSEPYGFRNLLEACIQRGYQTALSPYSVQSSLRFTGELATLTFPFRGAAPLFKGLRAFHEVRRSIGLSDYGPLDPNWFVWFDRPDDEIDGLVRLFLVSRVREAEERAQEILTGITYQTYGIATDDWDDDPFSDKPPEQAPQGGDWQPDIFQADPQLLREVLDYCQGILSNVTDELYNPGFGNLDLYEFIGRLQVFLDPKLLVFGRRSRDQKQGTRLYMSKIVKYCLNQIKTGLSEI